MCFLCPYGSHLGKSEKNKFELLKEQHQQQYKALDKLGIKRVLMDMNVNISNDSEYMKEKEIRQNEIKQWYINVENDLKLNKENSKYWMFHKYFNLDKQVTPMKVKVGDKLEYQKCTCGDDLTEGNVYEVLAVKGDMFMFLDDKGNKRVRSIRSNCFKSYKS